MRLGACLAASLPLAIALVAACSSFGESDTEAMPGADAAPVTESGAGEEVGPVVDASDGGRCAGDAQAFCEDFDETSGGLTSFPRWAVARHAERLERVTEGATSAPYALRVSVPSGSPSINPELEGTLPVPSRSISCTGELRIVSAASKNALEIGIRLEPAGPAAGESLAVLMYLTQGSRELGVYQTFADGGADYSADYASATVPHTAKPVTTSVVVTLGPPATATLRWPGAPDVTVPLDGKLPSAIGGASLTIGAKRVDPTGPILDVRFDDVSCVVD